MVMAFLIVNGVLYIALALWCTLQPTKTSQSIGFSLPSNSARSEYLVVYGGLELAMGAFFLLCAFMPGMATAGLWFALLTYACLALYRWATVLTLKDLSAFIYTMVGFESVMALLAAWLVWGDVAGT